MPLRKIILGPLMPAFYGSGLGWLMFEKSRLTYPSAIIGALIAVVSVYIIVETDKPGHDTKRLWNRSKKMFWDNIAIAVLCMAISFIASIFITKASMRLLEGTNFEQFYIVISIASFLLGSIMLMSAARATIVLMLGCGGACYCFILALPHQNQRILFILCGAIALIVSITIAFRIWKSGLKSRTQIET